MPDLHLLLTGLILIYLGQAPIFSLIHTGRACQLILGLLATVFMLTVCPDILHAANNREAYHCFGTSGYTLETIDVEVWDLTTDPETEYTGEFTMTETPVSSGCYAFAGLPGTAGHDYVILVDVDGDGVMDFLGKYPNGGASPVMVWEFWEELPDYVKSHYCGEDAIGWSVKEKNLGSDPTSAAASCKIKTVSGTVLATGTGYVDNDHVTSTEKNDGSIVYSATFYFLWTSTDLACSKFSAPTTNVQIQCLYTFGDGGKMILPRDPRNGMLEVHKTMF